MRWSDTNYPEPMRKLHDNVRRRAVEIANKLVEEGMEENVAISTAIDRAVAWQHHRNDPGAVDEGRRNYRNESDTR